MIKSFEIKEEKANGFWNNILTDKIEKKISNFQIDLKPNWWKYFQLNPLVPRKQFESPLLWITHSIQCGLYPHRAENTVILTATLKVRKQ